MKIHHITPADYGKDFGYAINYLLETLPDEDWIALRDIDTLPLNHRAFIKQCHDIASANEYQLVGGITNRLGLQYQLHEEKLSDNWDLKHHIKIADARVEKYGSEVTELNKQVAGFFMLFPVWLWETVGRFPEGGVAYKGQFLDWVFSTKVLEMGYKTGLAKGIYLFHLYRFWEKNVRMGFNHLL